jgi:hypothetical protein
VRTLFPRGADVSLDQLLADLKAEPPGGRLTVGDDRVRAFLTSLARKLLRPEVARRFPELASLGFFLRRSEIERAVRRITETPAGEFHFPRGVVFHLPPANVDTIFVYSWALSALAGNTNVVRISSRSAGAADAVLDALNDSLAEADSVVAATQRMVTYGHDDATTAALSAACDLRVIWGGDGAVNTIRRHPLKPSGRDVTFPDRASLSVISVDGWRAADEARRRQAVEDFTNDAYWFDQAACSSPRTVFWVGSPDDARPAQEEFATRLAEVVARKGWLVDAAMAVEKRVSTYGLAADGDATRIDFHGNSVAMLELARPDAVPRRWLGAGTFPQAVLGSLADLVPIVSPKDQTLTYFGFEPKEMHALAHALGGRGIERIVPLGSALSFAAIWDGYDLLREFTKITTVS